jgi:phosphatidylglycerophosphate synthase
MKKASKRIRHGRERTNILKDSEFKVIEYLCGIMPSWIKPDHLTFIGLAGSAIVFASLILSIYYSSMFLLLGVFGLAVQWFGDSLDGRLAYYRNTPRKWYGWALDINADWISVSIIGLGFYFYFPEFKFIAFLFVMAYGGSMIIALLRYKITDKYQIDSMFMGPTEMRILISLVLIAEVFLPGSLIVFAALGSVTLMVLNTYESVKVLISGDQKDLIEKRSRMLNGC